ncbi:hypothetical protein L596_003760 [Steinernema carpocapsae]|uniref:SURP motif domain-containing protein n=2 Tax=Steinernema carpocapsae TaxID=34508 RepID=A0A4U8UTM4_STECR|nr:hypothetical protein L596_003760 [Steinernema carpocapsae]
MNAFSFLRLNMLKSRSLRFPAFLRGCVSFDGRLHLSHLPKAPTGDPQPTADEDSAEILEEEACEEERYLDMYRDIEQEKEKRNASASKKTEIGFSYEKKQSSPEESALEPYEIPEGFKPPVGVNVPETMKQHEVIERTARFIVSHDTQMEIIIKAKQRDNEMFGFLDFDHPLNPYYKVVLKLMREKRYPSPRPKAVVSPVNKKTKLTDSTGKPINALAAIALAHNSDDSDSEGSDEDDDYLHPSLMGQSNSAQVIESGGSVIGPTLRPSAKQEALARTGKLPTLQMSNTKSVYAMLTQHIPPQNRHVGGALQTRAELKPHFDNLEKYLDWYKSFYGKDFGEVHRSTVTVATPSLQTSLEVVENAAIYVSKYGVKGEDYLKNRPELNFDFLNPSDKFFMYYQIRLFSKVSPDGRSLSPAGHSDLSPEFQKWFPSVSNISLSEIPFTDNRKRKIIDTDEDIAELLERPESSSFDKSGSQERDEKMRMQQQRKEKARKFMALILQQKLAQKQDAGDHKEESCESDGALGREEKKNQSMDNRISRGVDHMIKFKLTNVVKSDSPPPSAHL